MQEIVLPKGYLSYSAMELWNRDKQSYRQRYYLGEPYFSTPYTEFGNVVGEALEHRQWDHPVLQPVRGKIPQGTHPEYSIDEEIQGVRIFGKLDDFHLQNYFIEEYKTGIRDANGNPPWDRVKVRKHKQLVMYTMLVRKRFGTYNPEIRLTWMETNWGFVNKEVSFGGQTLQESVRGLYLTGHVETFDRTIRDWELDRMEQIIRKTAEDISEDYQSWKKNPTSLTELPTNNEVQ